MTLDINIRKRMAENKKYLSEGDLADGRDRIVQIKDVVEEIIENPKIGRKDKGIVLHFEGDIKPMVLGSKVNMTAMIKATGTDMTKDWVGKKIQLFRGIEARSETGFAVRIRDFEPQG